VRGFYYIMSLPGFLEVGWALLGSGSSSSNNNKAKVVPLRSIQAHVGDRRYSSSLS
jgi:hypothetical protein